MIHPLVHFLRRFAGAPPLPGSPFVNQPFVSQPMRSFQTGLGSPFARYGDAHPGVGAAPQGTNPNYWVNGVDPTTLNAADLLAAYPHMYDTAPVVPARGPDQVGGGVGAGGTPTRNPSMAAGEWFGGAPSLGGGRLSAGGRGPSQAAAPLPRSRTPLIQRKIGGQF